MDEAWPDQLDELRSQLADGMPVEEAIALMRERGLTRIESIKVLRHLVVTDLGAAKQLIDDSPTWTCR
ncbi:hypothetical protein AB0J85_29950 [Micromonospora echinofusca]|uniref:hypothetical protein n=1 Tax=Micromonospora echinofusca TaxID=47858 RepID=UPI003421CFA5